MRRLAAAVLLSALALTPAQASAAGGPCNGQIDYDCTYQDSLGRTRHCNVWYSGSCIDPIFATESPFGGTCNGTVDVDCTEWSGQCTLWVNRVRCVVG